MSEKISAPSLVVFFLTLTVQILLTCAEGQPLRLIGRTSLPDYDGDFDHFAADIRGSRLFLAGEDRGTLEVFDLKTNELRPAKVANPGAGREHRFRAWRLKGSPADPVAMRSPKAVAESLESEVEDADPSAPSH